MDHRQSQSILFELLRSFTTLARTLNLTHAVQELNSTRQTVRRHIAQLEELRGEKLFDLVDRHYVLTESGARALPEAYELLGRSMAWLTGSISHVGGLINIEYTDDPEFDYYLQQHPISTIWSGKSDMVREALICWANAKGQIEDPAMQPIRDYLIVYRLDDDGSSWNCAEIGDKSSYSSWFGWAAARSSIGRSMERMPGGNVFATLNSLPFQDVAKTHGLRIDHIHTQIVRPTELERIPISYQRLMMGCSFPDGSFALASVVDRTYELKIDALTEDRIKSMPPELVMEFDKDDSKLHSISA